MSQRLPCSAVIAALFSALAACSASDQAPASSNLGGSVGSGGKPAVGGGAGSGASTSSGAGGSAGSSALGGGGGAAQAGFAGASVLGGAAGNGATSGASSGGSPASAGSPATAGSAGSTGSGGTAAVGGSAGAAGTGGSGTGVCSPPAPGSTGKNPLFSDQYTADPAPFVDGCTFYIHCGHDQGSTGFDLREWFVLKSTDMVTWTKKVAMKLDTFSWANANAWAGQVVKKGSKYYWYVPVSEKNSGMAIGVAVADSPEGPFTDALGHALIDDASEMAAFNYTDAGQTVYTIDPTVFVDDDGQAYLHYGGFGRMVQMKLKPDMISIDGKMTEVTPQGLFEAPFLSKRNGIYYEIYAAGSNPATIDYATSSSPLGPWTRKGRVLDALPAAAGQDAPTNHAGVAELAGQWYIVYHLSNGPNNGGTYKREVAIDKLTFNADGTIQKVTPSSGLKF